MFPVLSLVERDGKARSFHIPNVRGAVFAGLGSTLTASRLMTDEAQPSNGSAGICLGMGASCTARTNTSAEGPSINTNTVEGFFSILKRGFYGVFHHVREAHFHRYLREFDFRYSTREKLGVNDVARASTRSKPQRAIVLPTKQLTSNGAKGERYPLHRKRHKRDADRNF